MDLINTLLEKILDKQDLPLFVLVLLLVIGLRAFIIGFTLWHPGKGRDNNLKIIRQTYFKPYRNRLKKFLNYTAINWFKDDHNLVVTPRDHVLGTFVFTEPSFNFLLRLAIIYPITSMWLIWSFSSNAGSFGELEILLNVSMGERALMMFVIFAMLHLFKQASISLGWKVVAAIVVVGFGFSFGDGVIVLGAISAVTAAAVASTVNGAGVSGAGSAGVGAFVGICTLVGFVNGVGGLVGVALVGVAYIAVTWLYKKYKGTSKIIPFWIGFYLFHGLFYVGIFSVFPLFAPDTKINQFSILFFLGVLPLLNAPLDWLSLGITRSLLYSITNRIHSAWKIIVMGFADFMIALCFLFLIALLTTVTIAGINYLFIFSRGEVFINLPKVFTDLRINPWDSNYYWLYFMFLFTLIPTVFHALIAIMSVVFVVPKKTLEGWASGWKKQQHKNDFPTFLKAWAYLSFMPPLVYLMVPAGFVFLIWLVLFDWSGVHIGSSLLNWIEAVASRIDPGFNS